ncbi:MAG: 2OG-Fe(II) oxygenase [Rhodanobacteraceae bacterium]
MDQPDFIEVYNDALDAATCAALIARFETSDHISRGATGGGVDTQLKDSWDIQISGRDEWADAERALNSAMLEGAKSYVRTHAYAALAPLSLRMPDAKGSDAVLLDPARVAAMDDALLQQLVVKVFRPGRINLQKYIGGVGGYPYWHSELYPRAGDADTLHRVLLWTIYLNDGFSAGETEFFHQGRKIKPRTGSLLIAPAGFTHTHRGNRPIGGDKFIATSWILFQNAEVLYRQPAGPTS